MPNLILQQLADLDAAAWDALVPPQQPFACHAFLSSLEDSGSVSVRTGWAPAHRLLTDADGRLRAALPAYVKQHSFGEYVFDHGWADACERAGIAYYPKLLCAVPFSPVTGPRLLGDPVAAGALVDQLTDELLEQGLSGAHINFTDADADSIMRGREGWMERLGCQFHWQNRGYRDFQDFLDSL
ncbi:MAG: peptidogalycan biosysnthesis protein, partial [Pseudomonas sp.]